MSAAVYESVSIDNMDYQDDVQMYFYECPCGDKFEISLEDLYDGEDIAPCPSCTLQIRVVFDEVRALRTLPSASLRMPGLLDRLWVMMLPLAPHSASPARPQANEMPSRIMRCPSRDLAEPSGLLLTSSSPATETQRAGQLAQVEGVGRRARTTRSGQWELGTGASECFVDARTPSSRVGEDNV